MTEIIKVEHIYKDYLLNSGLVIQKVLKDINLCINKGEFVSIMGQSGSGKSTFMNILGCLDRPTSGNYFLNNRNVATLEKDELAVIRNNLIGFVFQGFNLLSRRTVFDNVAMPLMYAGCSIGEKTNRVTSMLASVKLENYLYHYPTQLSGGMQQRVAIARALINNPSIVFADEPTGNLDIKTSNEIMDLFVELNEHRNISIVMVTHEPSIARYSKRLIYIKDGVKEHDCSLEKALESKIFSNSP
jgi:putative ABC transport system ATP-binding protein